jgi:putative ABC transport system permease protein
MRAIDQKLVRDLWRMRGQVLTITLVLAAGLAAYVSLRGAHAALSRSRDAYYADSGFPDAFVHLERAPDRVAARLAEIPGVASVETRLVEPALFRIPGLARPPAGRAISLPASGALALRRGREPDPARDDELLLLDTFAVAHGIVPGDRITILLGGRELRLRVVGTALSPEYVFPFEGGWGGDRSFGVVWMTRDALAAATGKRGVFDDATFRLARDVDARGVLDAIDRVLTPYGGLGAYARRDQGSDRALRGELEQLEVLAVQVPALFILVTAFLLNVVIGRIIHLQREQLAVLRALGYPRRAIARHVLGFALVIVGGGLAVGLALGRWLGGSITALYADFFHFPVMHTDLDRGVVATAIVVALVAGLGGTAGAAWRAMRLAPAEAMRPPMPARYRRGVLSRLGIARLAGPMGRMIVRDLERRPWSSAIAVVGLAFAVTLVILGRFSMDSMEHLMDVQLARSMREDVAVVLARPVPRADLGWFRHATGVLAAEPMRTVPVRIRAGVRRRDVAVTAWPRDGRLRQVLDSRARAVPLPEHGVLMTALLAERLAVRAGDVIALERLDGDRRTVTTVIAALVDDPMGLNVYSDLDALARLLGEEPQLSTVLLEIDRSRRDRLMVELAAIPQVVMVTETQAFRDAFYAQSGESVLVFSLIVVGFGAVIAVGVVYNTARIALSERSRDLATLRVLGYTRDEVATVLLGQQAVQVLAAVPVGLLGGYGVASFFMSSIDPEQFRLGVVISPATYAFASLVVIGAAIATSIAVRRRLDRIDIVSALKARD